MSQITEQVKHSLKKRYAKEKRFKRLGLSAVIIAFIFLIILLTDIIGKASPAFTRYYVTLPIDYDVKTLKIDEASAENIKKASFQTVIRNSLYAEFPNVTTRADKKLLNKLLSDENKYLQRDNVLANPDLLGQQQKVKLLLSSEAETFLKYQSFDKHAEKVGQIEPAQIDWLKKWHDENKLSQSFNWGFFSNSDSSSAEVAGIKGAVVGSLITILITFCISFPIGLLAALYLEEFAPKNRFTDLLEININNLAAVPSIVFGVLGLAIFQNFFGLPRSAPLLGGLVLTLMTLPTIIISSRAAIKSVPPSLKEAALGLGASKMQTTFHHVVPIAMPGILTGSIIGMAQAIGETAPLLLIGMIGFIAEVPTSATDSATVLPSLIYLWAKEPAVAFTANASAAILILLLALMLINAGAVYLRKKFEVKW